MNLILPDGTRLDASGTSIAFRIMSEAMEAEHEDGIIPISDLIGKSERCTPS